MFLIHTVSGLVGIALRMGFNLLWLPIFLVTRNLFLTVILAACFMVYLYMSSDDVATRKATNQNPASFVVDAQGNKIQVATPVRRTENGDSAFTNDLYAQMTAPERQKYSQHFFHAMTSVPDGKSYQWADLDIAGTLLPGNSFQNKSGARCRMFRETLKVHAVQQTINGMACDNGGGTWCKLSTNATPACGLSGSPGLMDSISRSFKKLF